MNIAVIAANGRLGEEFVSASLKAGHTVRAGIHSHNNFSEDSRLEVMVCDATNVEDVRKLLKNQDVVVSAIGHVKGSAPDMQTKATEIILQIMKEQNIKRFVDVTGTGARCVGDIVGLVDHILNAAVRIVDPARVEDGKNHLALLQKSDSDWTSIRVLKLQNTTAKPFELRLHGPTKWYIGRQEVAKAMLLVIENGTFIKQAPIIGKALKGRI